MLTREHRLYQADWLMRKYGFRADEIPLDSGGNLFLDADPKKVWARRHPEFFPVNVNNAPEDRLLRVPGLGQVTVEKIMALRQSGVRLRSLENLRKRSRILKEAEEYLVF
jgi:predicted DNA-binding helix-hairpin-helix protein